MFTKHSWFLLSTIVLKLNVLYHYRSTFARDLRDVKVYKGLELDLELRDPKAKSYTRQYRADTEEIDRQVKQLYDAGLLRKNDDCSWNSPVLCVGKKDGSRQLQSDLVTLLSQVFIFVHISTILFNSLRQLLLADIIPKRSIHYLYFFSHLMQTNFFITLYRRHSLPLLCEQHAGLTKRLRQNCLAKGIKFYSKLVM